MFIPEFDFFPSRIHIKEFKYFNPKKIVFLSHWNMIRVVNPGSGSWFLPNPDPVSRSQKRTGSRMRNSACDKLHIKEWARRTVWPPIGATSPWFCSVASASSSSTCASGASSCRTPSTPSGWRSWALISRWDSSFSPASRPDCTLSFSATGSARWIGIFLPVVSGVMDPHRFQCRDSDPSVGVNVGSGSGDLMTKNCINQQLNFKKSHIFLSQKLHYIYP